MTTEGLTLIVGAGPTGMVAARELARRGIPCRVIDKATGRSDKSRAIAIQARTLELMDLSGIGAEPFLADGHAVHTGRIHDDKGELLARIDFDALRTRHPYMLLLPQDRTEAILESALRACGVSIERGVELVHCVEEPEGVQVALRHADGTLERFAADWVLGCDGAHSAVRKTLNMPFEGGDYEDRFLLADVAVDGDLDPSAFHVFAARQGPLALFPLRNSRFRLVADDVPESWGDTPSLAQCQQLVDERSPIHLALADPRWTATFHLHHRKVQSMRKGRALLAGDAAHIHSPAGGQGMNTGIQDAINLGWKLALVVHGVARPALLDSYDGERRHVVDAVLKMSDRLTRLVAAKNPAAIFLRDHLVPVAARLRWVRERASEAISELAIAYPDGAVLDGGGAAADGLRAGDRAPDAEVVFQAKGVRLYEAMRHPGFTAIVPATGSTDLGTQCEAFGARVVAAVPAGPYERQRAYLVRPDGYIALCAPSERFVVELREYLRRFFVGERLGPVGDAG